MDINVQNKIFWYTILVQGGGGRRGGGGGMLTSKLKKNIMSYINSTTPNRYTLSQHNTIAENVKYWLKTARQREITLAAGLTLCILWWGGQVWGGGGHRVGGWPWQTSDSGIRYTSKTPILSAYSTTKRDNSSGWPDTVYCGEEERQSPVLGCYIYSYIIYNLNLCQCRYLPSKGISLCKKNLIKSCSSQELWPSVLWEEGKTSL